MKAIVYTEYGSPDVLRLDEVEKPTPRDNEILVKVHATSANAADWHLLRGDPFLFRFYCGLFKPRFPIIGNDIAGRVEAVGKSVTQFKPGDDVFGDLSPHGFGGYAEYACAPETAFVRKPESISYEEAAAVPTAGLTALQALRDRGNVQPGRKVLINGASGGVGTFAVQIAKALGAEVTAVCSSRNVDRVRALGADHVIDYTREDFTQSGQHYDCIFAANGDRSIGDYQRALAPHGVYVMTGGTMKQLYQALFLGPWIALNSTMKMGNLLVKPNQADLAYMRGLLETGQVSPVIVRRYPLREVPDAIRYLEEGHAQGKVIITIA